VVYKWTNNKSFDETRHQFSRWYETVM